MNVKLEDLPYHLPVVDQVVFFNLSISYDSSSQRCENCQVDRNLRLLFTESEIHRL